MAMQAQRLKEEVLVERGEQYQRAIRLYFQKHRKYPRDLDDLEDTDGIRYLRRRYTDPMGDTGEWRLIHMGTDGRFEDSLLHDVGRNRTGTGVPRFSHSAGQSSLGMPSDAPGRGEPPVERPNENPPHGAFPPQYAFVGAEAALRTRQSSAPDIAERGRYSQGFEFDPSRAPDAIGAEGDTTGGRPDYSKMLPSTIPMDENEFQARHPEAAFGERSVGRMGSFREERGLPNSRASAGAGRQASRMPQGVVPTGQPGSSATSGVATLVNRLLTTPRTGGMAGAAGPQPATVTTPVFERGIAGVASTSEDSGVKVYGGKRSFDEWEFVYDYRGDSRGRAMPSGASQTGADRAATGRSSMQQRPGSGFANRPRR